MKRNNFTKTFFLSGVILFLSSCATLVRKDFKEDVTFNANGEKNVDVFIDGEYKGQAPQTVTLDAREGYDVQYAKQGMEPNVYRMRGEVQPKYVLGDIVMGGAVLGWIPLIVDGVTDKWRSFDSTTIDNRYKNFDWTAGSYSGPGELNVSDENEVAEQKIDSDGDGVLDVNDDCPKVMGLVSLKGCPDRDNDGIADNVDDCPDVKGIAKLKGCPEVDLIDSDGDGIPDTEDACPKVPGIKKLNGCPKEDILDTDGDGVPDSEDLCPEVKGLKTLNGCPKIVDDSHGEDGKIIPKLGDHGQILNWRDIRDQDLPDVKGKMFEIKNLNFETGSAKIKSESYKELNDVVTFLKATPSAKIDVEGHTDSQGAEAGNLTLSQKRAKSVVAYLVSKGISQSRLVDHGYGEAKPVATNETAEGRATNRRVEFHFK